MPALHHFPKHAWASFLRYGENALLNFDLLSAFLCLESSRKRLLRTAYQTLSTSSSSAVFAAPFGTGLTSIRYHKDWRPLRAMSKLRRRNPILAKPDSCLLWLDVLQLCGVEGSRLWKRCQPPLQITGNHSVQGYCEGCEETFTVTQSERVRISDIVSEMRRNVYVPPRCTAWNR